MAKKINKEMKGRVIRVSKADRRMFKIFLMNLEDKGVTKSPDEIADEIFSYGLHTMVKFESDETEED